jgi:NitT/TauT family transport system substrate-binding protein
MARLVSLALASLLAAGAARAEEVVKLGNLKFAHYGAVSYMKEHCKRSFGVDVQETVFPKGIDIFPAIVRGEVDLAASAADAAIANRAGGGQIFVVAGFAKGGARLVAGKDEPIAKVADLRGKKVGVARGGAQELLLLAELSKAGLTWSDAPGKDVQVVYLPFADLNQALFQKQIAAMCQSEPQSSQAINKGFGKEVLKPYDTPLGEPVRVLVMSEKLYREKPQVAQKVMDCFVDATRHFLQNPKVAERYVVDQMFKGQITADDYGDAMSNAAFTYDVTPEHIQVTTDLMVKYGVGKLQSPPQAADWVALDLLQKAKQKAGVKQ